MSRGEHLFFYSQRHIFKSHPIMMLTDYIRSDGHSTDTPTVTSLTWECVAVVMIRCRLAEGLKWLFASSGEKDNDDTPSLPAEPAWVLGSLRTSVLCRRQWRSVRFTWWISTWTREREQLTGVYPQTSCYTTWVVTPFVCLTATQTWLELISKWLLLLLYNKRKEQALEVSD